MLALRRPPGPQIARHLRVRYNSTQAPSPSRIRSLLSASKTSAKYAGYLCLSSVVGLVTLGVGILAHDALTYSDRHVDRVPVSPLALSPQKGGPKNLPVAGVQIDDEEDEEMRTLLTRPKLVIVGGGWGAIGVLKTLHPGDYHVTVVSADTFTTFTPLLPSAAVGTVSVRSLIEPIRKVIARLRGHFIAGKAVDLVLSDRLVEVQVDHNGKTQNIYLPYDKLIIAVGSTSSTHGVPGLENCFQLKTVSDAQAIRRRVLDNFEAASLPTTPPEERKRLLSFVICGGGPTGVETAAEIFDFCQEDIMNYFPKICREEVSIHVIQSREHILNTYSEEISKFAEAKFARDKVNLITSARVAAVTPEHVLYTIKKMDDSGKLVTEQHTVPHNFVLWSTGIAMNPFTSRVASLLPNQAHKKAIETDAHLRVLGTPAGEVYAIGDCANIETSLVGHFLELVEACDKDKNGKIDFGEWESMVKFIKKRVPMAEDHLVQVRELFQMYDTDSDENLSLNELVKLLEEVGNRITSLPATAQVASQQGKYLGNKLHKLARKASSSASQVSGKDAAVSTTSQVPTPSHPTHQTLKPIFPDDESVSQHFKYFHLGSLAYIGNAAVFDFGKYSLMGGVAAMYAWRSIYWNEQVSARTRALLMIDWIIRGIWGRDLSKL
ncbi:mitochondrial NADH dehydrogenase [Coprinopsis marcescibilis]|uniref:Mitochondrial NADH dehydrogenase n=1 Tax=Coprinopsis marcescibilis TaxID=230819 RepID=A0A5C3LB73_COPMA|nr:mitochondrial NADH dehydrogenase [Coprinopsis marcescibilis]